MDDPPLKSDDEIAAARIGPPEVLNRPITLAEYDSAWPVLYEREAARIRAALADRALLIEHVGSTSVPGLAAKPHIDVVVAVADSSDEASYVPALEDAGYVVCEKSFAGRTPRTEFRLAPAGRRAFEKYLDHMDALIAAARKAKT